MLDCLDNVTLELVPHAASVDPDGWPRSHDDRPLSPQGWLQASRLAEHLGAEVAAIYSSPALRCVQTVEPLGKVAGRTISLHEGLRETDGYVEPAEWVGVFGSPVGASFAAGRGAVTLANIAGQHPGKRVVVCSHADIIPVTLTMLASLAGVPLPHVIDRGGWFRLQFSGGGLLLSSFGPLVTSSG